VRSVRIGTVSATVTGYQSWRHALLSRQYHRGRSLSQGGIQRLLNISPPVLAEDHTTDILGIAAPAFSLGRTVAVHVDFSAIV
jgi:hypothetical protein